MREIFRRIAALGGLCHYLWWPNKPLPSVGALICPSLSAVSWIEAVVLLQGEYWGSIGKPGIGAGIVQVNPSHEGWDKDLELCLSH